MPFKAGKDLGYTKAEVRGIKKFFEHLRREFGEYSVVIRTTTGQEIQISSIGRELEMEGSVNETVQSLEEALTYIRAQIDSDRNPEPTGHWGSVGAVWHSGSWRTPRDKPNEVQGQVSSTGSNEPPDQSYIQLED